MTGDQVAWLLIFMAGVVFLAIVFFWAFLYVANKYDV